MAILSNLGKRLVAKSLARYSWQLTRTNPRSYLRTLDLLGFEVAVAIDAGAHLGAWTKACRQSFPLAEIMLIEPQATLLASCQQRFAGQTGLMFVESGLYSVDTQIPLFSHSRSDSFSFVEPYDGGSAVETDVCRVRRLDSLCEELIGMQLPSIVKLDCEGVELEAVQGAGSLFGSVPVFVVEAGLNNPKFSNSFRAVCDEFERGGYNLVDIAEAVRAPSGVLWNVDLVFIARNHSLAAEFARFDAA